MGIHREFSKWEKMVFQILSDLGKQTHTSVNPLGFMYINPVVMPEDVQPSCQLGNWDRSPCSKSEPLWLSKYGGGMGQTTKDAAGRHQKYDGRYNTIAAPMPMLAGK